MKHDEIRELVFLYTIDEINDEERTIVEKHIAECSSCKAELDNYLNINKSIKDNEPGVPGDYLLFQAREELFDKLYNQKYSESKIKNFFNEAGNWFVKNYKYSIVAAGFMIVGILLGKLTGVSDVPVFSGSELVGGDAALQPNYSNVQIVKNVDQNGNIELAYEKVVPQTYKGNINDPETREFLARTLVSASNPGVRISTVNTIAKEAEKNFTPDQVVKKSLINAIKADKNPAVRRTALTVLIKYPFDDEIKQTLLYILSGDDNSGLRVMAITALSGILENKKLDPEMIDILNAKAENDENGSVRLKAATLLQGAKN